MENHPDQFHPSTSSSEAENESLKLQIAEYRETATARQLQLRELEEKVSEGAAVRSLYDLQLDELKYLKNYIRELMQKAEAAAAREADLEKQVSLSVSTSHQLEDIRTKYNYLQAQLNDLTETLQQLNKQQVQQLLQNTRVAELESLLAIAEEEIELLKLKAGNKE